MTRKPNTQNRAPLTCLSGQPALKVFLAASSKRDGDAWAWVMNAAPTVLSPRARSRVALRKMLVQFVELVFECQGRLQGREGPRQQYGPISTLTEIGPVKSAFCRSGPCRASMRARFSGSASASSERCLQDMTYTTKEALGSSSGYCHSWCRCWWRGPFNILPLYIKNLMPPTTSWVNQ